MRTLDKLASAAPKAKAKDAKPEIHNQDLDGQITVILEQKRALETAKSLLATAEQQFDAFVGPERLRLCRQIGKVFSSVRVNNRVTYTQQCRYSNVPQEHRQAVEEAFGGDFGTFFKDTFEVALTKEATADEAFVDKLIAAIGEEEFMRRFVVRRDLEVTEGFHNAYTLNAKVAEKAAPLMDAGIIRPFKASNRE